MLTPRAVLQRPDLAPQKLNITTYEPDLVSPGYYFIAPIDHKSDDGRNLFIPAQIGPHIYDNDGVSTSETL